MGKKGGKLKIGAELDGARLFLRVSDTGPGIAKAVENKLFQSFVTHGKEGGTGLGLAIVKKIAEEHGGGVTFESSSSGATFQMELPQRDGKNADGETNPMTVRLPLADTHAKELETCGYCPKLLSLGLQRLERRAARVAHPVG